MLSYVWGTHQEEPSVSKAEAAEMKMLRIFDQSAKEVIMKGGTTLRRSMVELPYNCGGQQVSHINTLVAEKNPEVAKPKLLLLHGYGAASGFWAANLEALAEHYRVYAIDLPGFGRSSRHSGVTFDPERPEDSIGYFTDQIRLWVEQEFGAEEYFLAGHSFGGYLAGHYALRHSGSQIRHLILLDPWGMPVKQEKTPEQLARESYAYKAVKFLSSRVSPLSLVRALPEGCGKSLIGRVRSDITHKFDSFFGDDAEEARAVVADYIYQINAQKPATGEDAFLALSIPIAYARLPLEPLLSQLDPNMSLTFLYGDRSWMLPEPGMRIVAERTESVPPQKSKSALALIEDSSHHIYIDNAEQFNARIIECRY